LNTTFGSTLKRWPLRGGVRESAFDVVEQQAEGLALLSCRPQHVEQLLDGRAADSRQIRAATRGRNLTPRGRGRSRHEPANRGAIDQERLEDALVHDRHASRFDALVVVL
jgi:hypothetical protein